MFQYYAEDHQQFTGNRELDAVRDLNPHLQSFETWLDLHKDELKAAVRQRNYRAVACSGTPVTARQFPPVCALSRRPQVHAVTGQAHESADGTQEPRSSRPGS
jgi:hypothetical protein